MKFINNNSTETAVLVAEYFFENISRTMVYRTVSYHFVIPGLRTRMEETNEMKWSAVEDVNESAPTNGWSVRDQ